MSTGEGSRGGHIIRHTKSGLPIYQSQHRERIQRIAASSGIIGVGVGLGYYAGRKAAHITIEAAKAENEAYKASDLAWSTKGIGPLFANKSEQFESLAKKHLEVANKLNKSSFRLRTYGALGAAALIGIGVEEGLKETPLEKHPKTRAAVGVGASAAAYFAIRTGYEHALGGNLKHAASSAFRHLLRR